MIAILIAFILLWTLCIGNAISVPLDCLTNFKDVNTLIDIGVNISDLNWGAGNSYDCFPFDGVTAVNGSVVEIVLKNILQTPTPINLFKSICNLENLQSLELTHNNLVGDIPDEWGSCSALEMLRLQGNMISSMPCSFSNLTNLYYVSLYQNAIEGLLPEAECLPPNVGTLLLYINRFQSTLPSSWSSLIQMYDLEMDQNLIFGTLPPEWQSMTNLWTLYITYNNLSGTLPPEWSNMSALREIYLYYNNMVGGIPSEWADISNLVTLSLHNNNFGGFLPEFFSRLSGNLSNVLLSSNQFQGPIPSSWGSLVNLIYVDLSFNKLNGSLPVELKNWVSVYYLDLSNNFFTGTVPEVWKNMESLLYLHVNDNLLSGVAVYSSWLKYMNSLLEYKASNNLFTTFPPDNEIADLSDSNNISLSKSSCYFTFDFSSILIYSSIDYAVINFEDFENETSRPFIPLQNYINLVHLSGLNDWFGYIGLPSHFDGYVIFAVEVNDQTQDTYIQDMCQDLQYGHYVGNIPPGKLGYVDLVADGCFSFQNYYGDIVNAAYVRINCNNNSTSLYSLQKMNLAGNPIKSTLPSNFILLQSLQLLDLSNTLIYGALSSLWWSVPWYSLTSLNLAFTSITGPLPPTYINLLNLASLNLSNTLLNSPLPYHWVYSQNLQILDLSNSSLNGVIPTPINWISSGLVYFDISQNPKVGGHLPVAPPYNLFNFHISNTAISGSIPPLFNNVKILVAYGCPNLVSSQLPPFLVADEIVVNPALLSKKNYSCHPVIGGFGVIGTFHLDDSYDNYNRCGCNPGYYGSPPNCILCPINTYFAWPNSITLTSNSVCQKCPLNSQSAAGATSLLNCLCDAGYTRLNDFTCIKCSVGTVKELSNSNANCAPCSPGFFAGEEGMTACSPCPVGTYQSSFRADSCVSCPLNSYGYISGANSVSECNTCPNNAITVKDGATSSTECKCKIGYLDTSILSSDQSSMQCSPCVDKLNKFSITCDSIGTNIDNVKVNPKYWRENNSSLNVISCLNSISCIGNSTCEVGYRDFLCADCQEGYFTLPLVAGVVQCNECQISIWGLLLELILGQGVILINVAMLAKDAVTIGGKGERLRRKSVEIIEKEANLNSVTELDEKRRKRIIDAHRFTAACVYRLIFNQMQLVATTYRLNINWPSLFAIFGITGNAGAFNISGLGLGGNLKCILLKYLPTFPNPIIDLLFPFFNVLLALVLIFIFWKVIGVVKKDVFNREMYITIMVLFFMSYGMLINSWFNTFYCISFEGDGAQLPRLVGQYNLFCYQEEHRFWILTICLPYCIFMILSLPIGAFSKLRNEYGKGRMFTDVRVYISYSFFYEGLRSRFWFWECVVKGRQVLFMLIAVFLLPSDTGVNVQGITALFFYVLSILLQVTVRPYTDPKMNTIELLGLVASTLTVYFGMLCEYFVKYSFMVIFLVSLTYIAHTIWFCYTCYIFYMVNSGLLKLSYEKAKNTTSAFQQAAVSVIKNKLGSSTPSEIEAMRLATRVATFEINKKLETEKIKADVDLVTKKLRSLVARKSVAEDRSIPVFRGKSGVASIAEDGGSESGIRARSKDDNDIDKANGMSGPASEHNSDNETKKKIFFMRGSKVAPF